MLSDIDEKVDSSSKAVADKIFSFGKGNYYNYEIAKKKGIPVWIFDY